MRTLPLQLGAARSLVRPALVPFALVTVMVAHHVALWAWLAARQGITVGDVLVHWDSEHYNTIVLRGYGGSLFAYLPLYPFTVAALHALMGGGVPPQWIGAAFSLACFVGFVAFVARDQAPDDGSGLRPSTGWGWFLFVFSPASYVFHSHHGEAVFLFLSYAAFALAWRRQWADSAAAAGLSMFARNQGVLVLAATLALTFMRHERSPARARALAGTLALGVGCAVLLFALEWVLSGGNAVAHLEAQKHWRQAASLAEVARSFWWGNPWQSPYLDSAIHHALWFVVGAGAFVLRGSRWALAPYVWASLWLMPLQAELINVYRYTAVLFPVWFALGDLLARAPAWLRWPAAIGWLWLNHEVASNYALARWAY